MMMGNCGNNNDDDDVTFEKLVEKAWEESEGREKEFNEILIDNVVEDVAWFYIKKAKKQLQLKLKQEEEKKNISHKNQRGLCRGGGGGASFIPKKDYCLKKRNSRDDDDDDDNHKRIDNLPAPVPKKRRGDYGHNYHNLQSVKKVNYKHRDDNVIPKNEAQNNNNNLMEKSATDRKGKQKQCYDNEEEEEEVKKAKNTIKRKKIDIEKLGFDSNPTSPPNELMAHINKLQGTDVKLVLVKLLYPTDVSEHHDRLLIPVNQIKNIDFLAKNEISDIDNKQDVLIRLLYPKTELNELRMKQWPMKSTMTYAIKGWKNVVSANRGTLKKDSVLELWSFRVGNKLHIAVFKVGEVVDDGDKVYGIIYDFKRYSDGASTSRSPEIGSSSRGSTIRNNLEED